MTKVASLTLASLLTPDQLAVDRLTSFYDEAAYALAALPYLMDVTLVDGIKDTGLLTFPNGFLNLLEVWYEDRALERMDSDELDQLTRQWESAYGTPLAYTTDDVDLHQLQLYPVPRLNSDAPLLTHYGGAFGLDYPSGHVVLLATQIIRDLPSWLELPLIYSMLAREYALESDHQDLLFAKGCAEVSLLLMSMLPLPSLT